MTRSLPVRKYGALCCPDFPLRIKACGAIRRLAFQKYKIPEIGSRNASRSHCPLHTPLNPLKGSDARVTRSLSLYSLRIQITSLRANIRCTSKGDFLWRATIPTFYSRGCAPGYRYAAPDGALCTPPLIGRPVTVYRFYYYQSL